MSFSNVGSSPWVRGTRFFQEQSLLPGRFIPVGTGNTSLVSTSVCGRTVHPRGYGEHWHIATSCDEKYGSSPWVRGTLRLRLNAHRVVRFIPVGTGNTLVRAFLQQVLAVHPRGYGEH